MVLRPRKAGKLKIAWKLWEKPMLLLNLESVFRAPVRRADKSRRNCEMKLKILQHANIILLRQHVIFMKLHINIYYTLLRSCSSEAYFATSFFFIV
jgi:hypothetical protein